MCPLDYKWSRTAEDTECDRSILLAKAGDTFGGIIGDLQWGKGLCQGDGTGAFLATCLVCEGKDIISCLKRSEGKNIEVYRS